MILSQEKYDYFKKMVSQFNIIDISEKININVSFVFEIKENKVLKTFLINERKNLRNNEKRKYIIYSDKLTPIIIFLSETYFILVDVRYPLRVYDKQFNEIILYLANYDEKKPTNDFLSYFSVFYDSISLSVNNYEKNKLKDNLTFNLTKKASVKIQRSDKNKNTFFIDMKLSSKLVSVEFREDKIIAKFEKSLYKTIVLDSNCNILEVDFHVFTKKRLSLNSKINNITDYSSLMSSLSDNFDLYTLVNDSKFHSKTTEQHFNTHIDFIKKLNAHKQLVIDNGQIILNLMNDFSSYKETMLFQNVENLDLLNLNFYNYFTKKLTQKFSEDPLQYLFSDRTHGLERFNFFKAFFLLLLIEDKEINNDIASFDIIDSNTMNNLLKLQNILKDTYEVFND